MASKGPRVEFTTEPTTGGLYFTPYSAEFKSELMVSIPTTHRKWDGFRKAWFVSYDMTDLATMIARAHFPELDTADFDKHERTFLNRAKRIDDENRRAQEQAGKTGGGSTYKSKPPPSGSGQYRRLILPPEAISDYAILHVTSSAPAVVIRAAYRELAKLYHPDKDGGNPAKMRDINEAFARLKKQGRA